MNIIYESTQSSRIVFHYNKKHNEDQSIPQWVIKHKGETYYVNNIESLIGFRTKNTPTNEATKAALQFVGKLQIIDEHGEITAKIS